MKMTMKTNHSVVNTLAEIRTSDESFVGADETSARKRQFTSLEMTLEKGFPIAGRENVCSWGGGAVCFSLM